MRNNGKKRTTILAAALLALVMTLSLTACQVEIPGVGTININGGNTPTDGQVPGGNGTEGGEPGVGGLFAIGGLASAANNVLDYV